MKESGRVGTESTKIKGVSYGFLNHKKMLAS